MFNLLGNAVKFSKDNGVVELEVTYDHSSSDEAGVSPKTPSKTQQYGAVMARKAPFVDVTSGEDETVSRCPFHRPATDTKKEKIVDSSNEGESSAVEQDPTKNNTRYVHSRLFQRQLRNLRFVVTDYGKGINKSDFEGIFRPFQQASGTEMNAVYGGTGLGLAITKKLVTALGGTISVDSSEGSWSKFTVELPCSDPPAPVQELSKKMSDTTLLIVGLPECQVENLMRVFRAFSIDTRLVESLEEMSPILSGEGPKALPMGRRVLCLIHGDRLSAEWIRLASDYRSRWNRNISIFTFGPYVAKETYDSFEHILHIRSLEQVIPQSLIETLHEHSLHSRTKSHTTVSKSRSETRKKDISYHDLRILVAEDNKVNQKVMLRILARLGITSVDVVGNGQDAVDKEGSTAYDVILMDQQMPVMGGVQACRLILNRRDRVHPVPYIFFVTAHVSSNFEMECKDAGSSGFLPKPYKVADIDKCLGDVVKMITERSVSPAIQTMNTAD